MPRDKLDQQLARLEEIGGPAFVREMIDLFLELAPPRLDAARAGLQAGNLATVVQAVHALKSSAGNLGAEAVQGLAERIEQQARAGSRSALPSLMDQLEQALAEANERLRTLRGTIP